MQERQFAAALHDHLPRLSKEHYRGLAFVHWSMAIKNRGTGWLTELFHSRFREVLLHTAIRYELVCPTYCLMPDHFHCLWLGIALRADQLQAAAFFHRQINGLLKPRSLQKQAYDHVLSREEREHGAFQRLAFYIFENPVRKKLVEQASDYPFSGTLVPGYPDLSMHGAGYWDLFWNLYEARIRHAVTGAATGTVSTPPSSV